MEIAGDPDTKAALRDRIAGILAPENTPFTRVQPLEIGSQRFWLKRPERPRSLRWRLQKGDPRKAFARDLAGLRFMFDRGLAAPPIVLSGADYFVIEDAGQPLDRLLTGDIPAAEKARAVVAAGRALGALHRAGARHGRPKIRDICWDGDKARLIDMERFSPRASKRAMGLDLAILLHSMLEVGIDDPALLNLALRGYADSAPPAAVTDGKRWIRRIGLSAPLLRAALRFRPDNRELKASARLAEMVGKT
ncbi:lipopolysaccharide kinase InaA family protein [Pararhodobacter sp. SW119]|uniref:lipopolysaccharide kinase InaA family protein n=1 Tax=Pararhodobacter sp. SW119 TaxID=2780075 RepID=UPI001AE00987|nr:lipopolysaccharide kinase InaA family protein [Pararhodobacter sp. SW119]